MYYTITSNLADDSLTITFVKSDPPFSAYRDILSQLLNNQHVYQRVVINISTVENVDSSLLGFLFAIYKLFGLQQSNLTIIVGSEKQSKLLVLVGIDKYTTIQFIDA